MVTIAACFGALMLPLQCFMAIYYERTLPAELKPGLVADLPRPTFLFQLRWRDSWFILLRCSGSE